MSQAQSNAMNPGAMRASVRTRFEAYTPLVERALAGERPAAAELLDNPLITAELKAPLADYLARADATEVPNAQRYLAAYRVAMEEQVEAAVTTIERGTRTAFSNSITSMFTASLWICLLGLIITVFIPVIPLGAREQPTTALAD